MTMEYTTNSSRHLSKTLDNIGYSYEMIKHRQFKFEESDNIYNKYNAKGLSAYRVTTGGNGEGTTLYFESDTDHMFLILKVICTNEPYSYRNTRTVTIFETDVHNTPPGYTRLKLARFDSRSFKDKIQDSLFKHGKDEKYISSDFFINVIQKYVQVIMKDKGFQCTGRKGPSTPAANPYVCRDNVYAFTLDAREYLNKWVLRKRLFEWPSIDILRKMAELDGDVVPVGHTASEHQFEEWRIGFTKSELLLMRSLSEVQLKVVVLLKKIARHLLTLQNTKLITSYIMKNVAFWVFEQMPKRVLFTDGHILQLIHISLKFLKSCINDGFLPSYMIPNRNLLLKKIDKYQQSDLLDILTDLISDKANVVMRIEEIREVSVKLLHYPEQVLDYSERRDQMEKLLLIRRSIRAELRRPNMLEHEHCQKLSEHSEYTKVTNQLYRMVLPDMEELKSQGADIEDIFVQRISKIVR